VTRQTRCAASEDSISQQNASYLVVICSDVIRHVIQQLKPGVGLGGRHSRCNVVCDLDLHGGRINWTIFRVDNFAMISGVAEMRLICRKVANFVQKKYKTCKTYIVKFSIISIRVNIYAN